MNIRKTLRNAITGVFIMSTVSLPVAADTLPMSIKGFMCGGEDGTIIWTPSPTNGFGGGKLTAGAVALSSVKDLELVGVLADPDSESSGFRKFSAFIKILSMPRESEKHAEVQFRFRLSDNSLYFPTKRLDALGLAGFTDDWQQITVEAQAFDKDVSTATLEKVALYVIAGGTEGTKNLLLFGDITIETQNDVLRPTTINTKDVAGCEAIKNGVRLVNRRPRPQRSINRP